MRSISFWFATLAIFTTAPAQIYQAGTTFYPFQHNSSVGRNIGVDANGFVQVTWTNGLNPGAGIRHVYWNFWDPTTQEFVAQSGAQVDVSSRAGYSSLVVTPDGFSYLTHHEAQGSNVRTVVCLDFIPGAGAYTCVTIPDRIDGGRITQPIYPKIAAAGNNGEASLHILAVGSPWFYYARANPIFDDFGQGLDITVESLDGENAWVPIDSCYFVSPDIACSIDGQRVAIAYVRSTIVSDGYRQNDAYVRISEDGGTTWQLPRNITNVVEPDTNCYDGAGDWICCNRDTMRAIGEVSALFDDQGVLHVAITTSTYFYWLSDTVVNAQYWTRAQIWHWSEAIQIPSIIAAHAIDHPFLHLNANDVVVQKPSLSADSLTGDLYCSYLRYDTTSYSMSLIMSADVFISRSTNNGRNWSVGVNVTNTVSGPNAPNGENMNEQDASLTLLTRANHIYMVLERVMGTADLQEPLELNPILFYRISTDTIPPEPLMPDLSLHVPVENCAPLRGGDPRFEVQHPYLGENGRDLHNALVVLAADFNSDELQDIAAIVNEEESGELVWWQAQGEQTWQAQTIFSNNSPLSDAVLASLHESDTPVIFAVGPSEQVVYEFAFEEPNGFIRHDLIVPIAGMNRIRVADMDGDQDIDAVVSTLSGQLFHLDRTGAGAFTASEVWNDPQVMMRLHDIADLPLGTDTEILASNDDHGLAIFVYVGGGWLQRRLTLDRFPWCDAAQAIDLDGDTQLDILAASSARSRIHWWKSEADGAFTEHQISRNFSAATSVQAVDVNRDGRLDIVASASQEINLAWWENTGNMQFNRHNITTDFGGVHDVNVIDIDGDTDQDLLLAASNGLHWLENTEQNAPGHVTPADDSIVLGPDEFRITGIFPNPFNENTTIKFTLPHRSEIELTIFDLTGRLVAHRALLYDAGTHSIPISLSGAASGIYFAQLHSGDLALTAKLLYLR